MSTTPCESTIAMLARLRGEVLDGVRNGAWRPGHRDYKEGPATIRFCEAELLPRYARHAASTR